MKVLPITIYGVSASYFNRKSATESTPRKFSRAFHVFPIVCAISRRENLRVFEHYMKMSGMPIKILCNIV